MIRENTTVSASDKCPVDMDCIYQPTKIPTFEGVKIKQVSAWTQSAAVSIHDEAYVWGLSVAGDITTPQQVELPSPIVQAECGGRFIALRTTDGAIYAFGPEYYKESRVGDSLLTKKAPKRILASDAVGMSIGGKFGVAYRPWNENDDAPFAVDPEALAMIRENSKEASPERT